MWGDEAHGKCNGGEFLIQGRGNGSRLQESIVITISLHFIFTTRARQKKTRYKWILQDLCSATRKWSGGRASARLHLDLFELSRFCRDSERNYNGKNCWVYA